jgi:hypothetical protein
MTTVGGERKAGRPSHFCGSEPLPDGRRIGGSGRRGLQPVDRARQHVLRPTWHFGAGRGHRLAALADRSPGAAGHRPAGCGVPGERRDSERGLAKPSGRLEVYSSELCWWVRGRCGWWAGSLGQPAAASAARGLWPAPCRNSRSGTASAIARMPASLRCMWSPLS